MTTPSRWLAVAVAVLVVSSSMTFVSADGGSETSIWASDTELDGELMNAQVNGSGDDAYVSYRPPRLLEATDSDFERATALRNVTIRGTGETARVEPPTQAHVSRWRFESGSGSTATDSWASNDGTISGATWTTDAPQGTSALSFDGTDDYVDIPHTDSLNLTSSFTVSAHVQINSTSDRMRILEKGDSNDRIWYLSKLPDSSQFRFAVQNQSGTIQTVTSTNISTGTPHFAAARYNGSHLTLFVDGEQVDSVSFDGTPATTPKNLEIGAENDGGLYAFDGIIDDAQIRDRALTSHELSKLSSNPDAELAGDTKQYVSANHSTLQANSSWVNLTLDNATATVETLGYNTTTGSFDVVDSTQYDSTGNYSVSLSNTYSTYRVKVTFTHTGSAPVAELHDLGINGSRNGRYIGTEHAIANATLAFVALNVSNATADVTIEGYDDSTATWTVVGDATYTSTAFTTINLSGNYSKYRTRATFSAQSDASSSHVHVFAEGIAEASMITTYQNATPTPLVSALARDPPSEESFLDRLPLGALPAAVQAQIERAVHNLFVRLGRSDRNISAAEAASQFQSYYNDRNDAFTSYLNQRTSDDDIVLTAYDTIEITFTVGNESETRYLIGLVDGGRYATTTVVNQTNRTIDHTVELSGWAAVEAQSELKTFHDQFVVEGNPPSESYQTQLREKYGPDISGSLVNETRQ